MIENVLCVLEHIEILVFDLLALDTFLAEVHELRILFRTLHCFEAGGLHSRLLRRGSASHRQHSLRFRTSDREQISSNRLSVVMILDESESVHEGDCIAVPVRCKYGFGTFPCSDVGCVNVCMCSRSCTEMLCCECGKCSICSFDFISGSVISIRNISLDTIIACDTTEIV